MTKTVDVKSEAKTIRLYTISIILSVVAIISSFAVGASYTVLTFGNFIAVGSVVILVTGISYARKRKEVTTYYQTRGGAPAGSSTLNARVLGFIAAFWVLLLVVVAGYASLEFLYLVDIVPASLLVISGIIALVGAFTYKIR